MGPGLGAWLFAGLAAFLASLLSGVAGFGGGAVFLSVLVALYGPRPAVPILTLAVLMGNASRVGFYRKFLDLRVAAWFLGAAVPAAILGSMVYVSLPGAWIRKAIGAFLLSSVALRHVHRPLRVREAWVFAPVGAASGFLSAILGAIGPLAAPFFLAYGLAKEAFVGTEALCAASVHLTKTLTYRRLGILPGWQLAAGLGFGAVMSAGSYAAKLVLEKLSREKFLLLVEVLLVIIGLDMLIRPA